MAATTTTTPARFSDLNTDERTMLALVIECAADNGLDFTFGDDVVESSDWSAQRVGGYISSLQTKGYLWADEFQLNGRNMGTSQINFQFTDFYNELLNAEDTRAATAALIATLRARLVTGKA